MSEVPTKEIIENINRVIDIYKKEDLAVLWNVHHNNQRWRGADIRLIKSLILEETFKILFIARDNKIFDSIKNESLDILNDNLIEFDNEFSKIKNSEKENLIVWVNSSLDSLDKINIYVKKTGLHVLVVDFIRNGNVDFDEDLLKYANEIRPTKK